MSATKRESDRPVIEYSIPAKMPARLKWLRRLVILAGLSSFVSFITALQVVEAMVGELAEFDARTREAVAGLPADPDNAMVMGADAVTVAKHFAFTASGLLSLVFLYLPVRYFQLFRRIPKGHPSTYVAVRDVSIIQIMVELVKVTTFEASNLETAVIKFPAAASPALLFSIVVLVLITRARTRACFYRPRLVAVRNGDAGAEGAPSAPLE